MGGDPVLDRRQIHRRDGGIGVEQVARGNGAAEGQDRRPGKPVAPHRKRPDQLGIAQPGGRAIDRSAAGFLGEQPGNFRIGEGLDEAHDHRDDPHQEGQLPGGACDAPDREQDESRNAARHPERTPPVDGAPQFLAANRNCFGRHDGLLSPRPARSFHQCRCAGNSLGGLIPWPKAVPEQLASS